MVQRPAGPELLYRTARLLYRALGLLCWAKGPVLVDAPEEEVLCWAKGPVVVDVLEPEPEVLCWAN